MAWMFARYATRSPPRGASSEGARLEVRGRLWSATATAPKSSIVRLGLLVRLLLREALSEREKSIESAAPLRGMMRREMRRGVQARTRRDAGLVSCLIEATAEGKSNHDNGRQSQTEMKQRHRQRHLPKYEEGAFHLECDDPGKQVRCRLMRTPVPALPCPYPSRRSPLPCKR
ncbi:hypothetical protein F5X68DRAFT_202960 [Plectosphaerella plurivora]|uniref:Uncharacterized protein n=1 Tax=Plectosphaerella plurivora TaxID=936078 RepID=A0A9P8VFU7_9PEZI|nr:hypothetical protein F5X68DRAFT_202960 [Plectosphaerella plurivora]